MKKKPEIQRLEIALLGDFNPKIFSPSWFAVQDLIGETESESADIEVIHSDVAIFNLSWCRLQVTRDRFGIFSEQEAYFQILKDLVIGTFKKLEHTPVRALGINSGMHIKCDSEEEWHNFGHYLVPQRPWVNIFNDSAMMRVEMVEKHPPTDLLKGTLRIRVEASTRVIPGIFININDHYGIEERDNLVGCKKLINRFLENREASKQKTDEAINNIIKNFSERDLKI